MSLPRWIQYPGVRDWLLQRVTAVILVIYLGYLTYVFACTDLANYSQWVALFDNSVFAALFVLSIASLLLHAWVGLWTVITDYAPQRMQLIASTALAVLLIALFIWSCTIIL